MGKGLRRTWSFLTVTKWPTTCGSMLDQMRMVMVTVSLEFTGMRPGVRLDESADVAIEGDQDPVLEPAHGDQILVGRLAGDDGGLDHVVSPFQEPLGDGAIDVLIGEESHLQAADWGTSTTSSVESMAAA